MVDENALTELSADDLGVRVHEPPSRRFDPLKASPEELRAHALPTRPEAPVESERYQRWKRMVSTKVVSPHFGDFPEVVRPTFVKPDPPDPDAWTTSYDFSGSVAYTTAGDNFLTFSAEWTVPHIVNPGSGAFIVLMWGGVGGIDGTPILRIGTLHAFAGSWSTTYGWWEWQPANDLDITRASTITNVPIAPGDVMYCNIDGEDPLAPMITLGNQSQGIATGFQAQTDSPDAELACMCAEWMIELPRGAEYVDGNTHLPFQLGPYKVAYFSGEADKRSSGTALSPGDGYLYAMIDSNGHIISAPFKEGRALKLDSN